MSMFLPQNKFSKKLSGSLLLACFALTVVGCSRTEQKDSQNNNTANVEQKPLETSEVACNNDKATSVINSYLVNRIQQQANKQADIIQQQANTAVDMTILQNDLSQVAISLENVNGRDGKCQATVSFNMPQSQLDNADKIYTRLKLPAVAEQIVSRGYQLQNSTLVANKVGFGLSANGANYQVNSTTGEDVIGLVGEIMANSALAQTLTQPSNMPMSGSVPVVVPPTTTKAPVTTTNTEKSTTKPVKKPTPKPKTDSEKTTTTTTRTATKHTTTEVKTKTTPAKTTTQTESSDKKPVKKTETTSASTDSRSTSTKSTSSSNTEKSTKPVTRESVTHEKVPTDTNIKLNIEEKNEQY